MAMMCKRALHLSRIQTHQFFKIPTKYNLNPHERAEIAILNLIKKPKKQDFLRSIDMLVFDEMGQYSAETIATFDVILRNIRNSNIYMGGVLIIFYMDHTQIQPIGVHTFLTSCHITYFFKNFTLENSVRDPNDDIFKRIQKFSRLNFRGLVHEPEVVD